MIEVPVSASDRTSQVIHANWSAGVLHLWCEVPAGTETESLDSSLPQHPNAIRPNDLPEWVKGEPTSLSLRLPTIDGNPVPSTPMSRLTGRDDDEDGAATLVEYAVPSLGIDPLDVGAVLEWLMEQDDESVTTEPDQFGGLGPGIEYFVAASRLALHLLAGHRVVPMILQDAQGELSAGWYPWLSDAMTATRIQKLVSSMPGVSRAVTDEHAHDAWSLTTDFLAAVTDARCRSTMIREEMFDTV
ncbi:MAG: hypothetical protein HRT64_14225, partial [Erythrobacter sp.]|nr:hypothetical protein [Erythrobacter sp.]